MRSRAVPAAVIAAVPLKAVPGKLKRNQPDLQDARSRVRSPTAGYRAIRPRFDLVADSNGTSATAPRPARRVTYAGRPQAEWSRRGLLVRRQGRPAWRPRSSPSPPRRLGW